MKKLEVRIDDGVFLDLTVVYEALHELLFD